MPRDVTAALHLERALAHHRALLERHAVLRPGRSRGRPGFDAELRRALPSAPAAAASPAAERFPGLERMHYVVQPGDTLWALAVHRFRVSPEEIARQNRIEDPARLTPGQPLVVERRFDPHFRPVVASWYGPGFDGRPMANGRPYDRHDLTIAHRSLPLGTRVELRDPRTGVVIEARVEDRGPYVEGRDVDLSWRLARDLGILAPGVGQLEMRVL